MLDAAEELFSKHGLYGVTLKDVAQKVGVHTSLMHYYFEDKQDLFHQVVRRKAPITIGRRVEAMTRYAEETGDHPTVEGALRAFLDTDLDLYIEGGEGWRNYGALGGQMNNTPGVGRGRDVGKFRSRRAATDRIAEEGHARRRRRGYLLGLPLRHRRPDPEPGADGPDRSPVWRPVPVRRLRGHQGRGWRNSWPAVSWRSANPALPNARQA
jgi:AcrR family transcriptional regulator